MEQSSSICLTSAISAYFAALRIAAWPAALKRWRKGCKNRKERTGSWQSQSRRRWTLPFTVSTSSSTVQNPVGSKSLGILKAPCRTHWSSTEKLDAKEYNQDAASSSQGWPKDAVLDVGTWKLVASGNSDTEGSDKIWPHNLYISTTYVLHMEKVFSIVRQRYGLSPMDQIKNLDVNTAMWCIFMSFTLQAAVRLDKEYTVNLRSTKNQPKKSVRQLFQVTQRLITDETENYWIGNDWLAAACVERDDSAHWQSCSVCYCQNLRLFWLSAMSWRYQYWTSQCVGKQD